MYFLFSSFKLDYLLDQSSCRQHQTLTWKSKKMLKRSVLNTVTLNIYMWISESFSCPHNRINYFRSFYQVKHFFFRFKLIFLLSFLSHSFMATTLKTGCPLFTSFLNLFCRVGALTWIFDPHLQILPE